MKLIWFTIFVVPFVYCVNVTNVTVPTQEKQHNSQLINEKTNITLPSEGGTLLGITPQLLPKDRAIDKQLSNLLALDGELNKPKKTSTKPRKGANYTVYDNSNALNANSTKLQNSTLAVNTEVNKIKPFTILPGIIKNTTSAISTPTPINSTEVHKNKPLVLSYDALIDADKHILNETKFSVLNPSSKPLTNVAKSQIPSQNEDAVVKVYPSKVNSHPGMIMPIVITILVVPMFAIFGYLALKRGQEAWKNRHYKRMDFLLDGMYND